jgi:hypothetical protein
MATNTFVVDRALGAVPVSRLLDVRAQLRVQGTIDKMTSVPGDRPVLNGDQTLQPNTIYPAEKNAGVGYYLPLYRIAMKDGGPAVELRVNAGSEGEIGRLTISLAWVPPAMPGRELRVMDAIVTPRLRYRIPVQGSGGPSSGWERTTPLQPFTSVANGIQSITIFSDKGLFDSVYQALSHAEQGASLDLLVRARVGVKTWRQVVVGQATWSDQVKVFDRRGALFTDMVATDPASRITRVPLSGTAKVIMRKPVVVDTPPAHVVPKILVAAPALTMAQPAVFAPIARSAMVMRRMAPGTAAPMANFAASPAVMTAMRADSFTMVAGPRAAAPATMTAQPAVASAALLTRAYTPVLKEAVMMSDLRIAGRNAVPVNVVLDPVRQPAVVDADLDNQQNLPFNFDPSRPENRGVFISGYDSGLHLLVPLSLVGPDGSVHTVYRDSLMRDVIHMPPSGFRLERDQNAPFLPAISFLASDFSTTDNNDDADVLFRVVAAYRLEPWLNPDVVELARAELAKESLVAHFTTGTATGAKLSLDLDLLGDAQSRTGAAVDPATGIDDTLDLDHQTFVRLWRERLAAGGVTGSVQYQLFDGSPARVPVEISLRASSSELFDVTFIGPPADQPGRYRVIVRNRVESPARITGLPPELIAGGGVAHAVDQSTVLNQVLQPQETRQIDYQPSGGSGAVTEFSPTVIGYAEPNLPALLRLLMVARGYTSLGFSVSLQAVAGVFDPPAAGAEPLTGLLVEFDDGTRTTLTATHDHEDVTVVGRLIDQILGTADDSQRYFYRITNLHASGEGARTSWIERLGSGPLPVGSAVVHLDF